MILSKKILFNFVIVSFFSLIGCNSEYNEMIVEDYVNENDKSIEVAKPTISEAVSFIKKNLFLLNSKIQTRGGDDYKLEIDTIYFINYENKPFLKLVSFMPKGYALVSDIDNIPNPPVLFYSGGRFDDENANPALLEYIEEFLLTHSSDSRVPTGDEDKDGDGAWDDGRDSSTGDPRDSPYYHKVIIMRTWQDEIVKGPLLKTLWSQGPPFNDNCPVINGQKSVAGCVAIATGQIMNYFKTNTNKMYNWNNINNQINPDIGNFIRDIGNGVGMKYGLARNGGSSSNLSKTLRYFKNSGYPNSYITNYEYSNFKSFIEQGIPVYLRGNESRRRYKFVGINLPFAWKYEGGHAWVADGYKTITKKQEIKIDEGNKGGISYTTRNTLIGNYIHMNWGWGVANQDNGGWCTYNYFKNDTTGYSVAYKKKMLVPIK